MRPIDADALKKEAIVVNLGTYDYPDEESIVYESDIDEAPTLDVEPVVRCKSCKYMKEHHYERHGEETYIKRTCESPYGLSKPYRVEEWDYCSRGERRI